MGLGHAHGGGQSSNIGFDCSKILPAQGTCANIGHAAVVVTVALAARQIMKLGDVGTVVARSAFDIDSRHAGFARPNDASGSAPSLGTPRAGARFSFEAADSMHDIVIPRGFTELAVVDNIDA